MEELSASIKNFRSFRNMSQRKLAEKLNKSVNTVANWERGLSCPDVKTLIDLCRILQITPNQLLGWDDNKEYIDYLVEVGNARVEYEQARQDMEAAAKRMKEYVERYGKML